MFDHTQADIVIDVQHQEKCEQIFEHCLLKENVVMFFFFFPWRKVSVFVDKQFINLPLMLSGDDD